MRSDPEGEDDREDSRFESLLRNVAAARPSFAALPSIGQVVGGKYRIEALLGQGGMGAVYRAAHVISEKRVALKWLLQSTSDERARRRFVREALAAGRVDHPNVVNVYDLGQEGDCAFLVMELLYGQSLRARLKSGPLQLEEALHLLLPAMRGVCAMHRAGVIHRDLKPDNIFLCEGPDGLPREAKVLDFGISSVIEPNGTDPTITHDGLVVGTIAYMSPEQLESARDVDARTDVYSCGVLLFEALTGALPFEATSSPGLIRAIVASPPRDPQALRPELPGELGPILLRALAKRREERYESVDSFVSALEPFASRHTQAMLHSRANAPVARGSRVWLRGAALTAALGLLALTGWLLVPELPKQVETSSPAVPSASTSRAAASAFDAPFEEQPPFLKAPACEACLESECGRSWTACQGDATCRAVYDKLTTSKVPLVAARDPWRTVFDARWAFDHGASNWTPLRDKFQSCLRSRCQPACNLGRNLACVGQFDWPASYPSKSEMRLKFGDFASQSALDGLRIRACSPGAICDAPLGEVTTAGGGFATLSIDFSLFSPARVKLMPEFNGYLIFDGRSEYLPMLRFDSRPALDGDYEVLDLQSEVAERSMFYARNLAAPDAEHSQLDIEARDCVGSRLIQAKVEVWKPGESGFSRCTDCKILYSDTDGNPDATISELSWGGINVRAVLPPGDVMVVVRDTETGRPVSVLKRVEIRTKFNTWVRMMPASREQLAGLPAAAR